MSIKKKEAGFEFENLARKFVKDSYSGELTPDQFLKMPLTNLTDISDFVASSIKNQLGIKTIRELADWSLKQNTAKIIEIASKVSLSELTFETCVLLARMAFNLKDMKRSEEISMKYVFAGLGTAGKTSLINHYVYKSETSDALKTKPTLGMEPHKINYPDGSLLIWELGGQTQFQEMYINTPEKFFLSLEVLVFMVDVQNSIKFKESCEYFVRILDVLKRLGQMCHVVLLFHKADPAIMKSVDYLDNVITLRKIFIPEMQQRNFPYIIRSTSVYYSNVEMDAILGNILDIDLLSRVLMKSRESDAGTERKSIKDSIKSFFNRIGKDREDNATPIRNFVMPDDLTKAEIEVENAFQLYNTEAFKSLITQRDYVKAAPTIEYFVESWTKYRNLNKDIKK